MNHNMLVNITLCLAFRKVNPEKWFDVRMPWKSQISPFNAIYLTRVKNV